VNVTVFSASTYDHREDWDLAYDLGRMLAQGGHHTINGGGPGLMDAVLKGAWEAGGSTTAIQLSKHQRHQSAFAVNQEIFHELQPRQQRLMELGDAYIALPGGMGTTYEVFEILAMKNTGKWVEKPLVLLSDYWLPQLSFLRLARERGLVPKEYLSFFHWAPSNEEALKRLQH
jgi:hypothetical protein